MSSAMVNRGGSRIIKSVFAALGIRFYAKVATRTDIVNAAPNVSLQKARIWDEGMASKFSTTPLKDIFKDKKVVIFVLTEPESSLMKKDDCIKDLESTEHEQRMVNNRQLEEMKLLKEKLHNEARRLKSLERENDRLQSKISLLEAKGGSMV